MSFRILARCSVAASLVVGALLQWPSALTHAELRADPPDAMQDSDGDFLPDVLEWACLTSATSGDTDEDAVPDFIEVVQQANPRYPGLPLPLDHEMRVLATTTQGPNGPEVSIHLLFRFMGDLTLLSSFDAWAEIGMAPGLRFPLADFASGPITMVQRVVPGEGLWVRVSAPMVSESVLRNVLPCTLGADGVIGSRHITTKMPIIDRGGVTSTLVPYGYGLYAVQSIAPLAMSVECVNNRICVMRLQAVGNGTGGPTFQVVGAECQDCNDLMCGVDCANSVGQIITLPGGPGSITGG